LLAELKDLDRGDGVCKHLQEDNTCGIYDTRPDICNVRKMYDKHHKDLYTEEEYVKVMEEACNTIKKQFEVKNDKN